MKKITLSIALVAAIMSAKAQDTTCTMVRGKEIVEFNYQNNEIISREDYQGNVYIEVNYREVLCLHLFDDKTRVRKVIITYPSGMRIVEVLDSKDDTYYTPVGPLTVEVRKPKLMILR